MGTGGRRPVVGVLAGAALLGGTLTACTTAPDLTAVPVPAEAPYVCDGVSERAVELMFGEAPEGVRDSGVWSFPRDRFAGSDMFGCSASFATEPRAAVTIRFEPVAWGYWADTEENLRAFMQDQLGSRPIEASAPGWGYRMGTTDAIVTGWVCDDYLLAVQARGPVPEGRDRGEDVERLLVSMLPWACEGAEAPARS